MHMVAMNREDYEGELERRGKAEETPEEEKEGWPEEGRE